MSDFSIPNSAPVFEKLTLALGMTHDSVIRLYEILRFLLLFNSCQ